MRQGRKEGTSPPSHIGGFAECGETNIIDPKTPILDPMGGTTRSDRVENFISGWEIVNPAAGLFGLVGPDGKAKAVLKHPTGIDWWDRDWVDVFGTNGEH
jgi:hypothetical protein